MKLRNAISIILVITLIVSIGFFSYRRAVKQKKLNEELREAVAQNDIVLIKNLLRKGADPQKGLWSAAVHGNKEIVKLLLDKGADPNKYKTDPPIIMVAGHSGEENLRILELLVLHGADVNYRMPSDEIPGIVINEGLTPLLVAVARNCIGNVEFLIAKGADVNAKIYSGQAPVQLISGGQTALNIAVYRGYSEIERILVANGADISLFDAVGLGDMKKVKDYINDGEDINAKVFGISLLELAVKRDRNEVLALLLGKGADINVAGGYTKIAKNAIQHGQVDVVKLLLDYGMDINIILYALEDPNLQYPDTPFVPHTLLTLAVDRSQEEIIKLLISEGADVNRIIKDKIANPKVYTGQTALNTAVYRGYAEIEKILIANGADISLFDAVGLGDIEKVKDFINRGEDINARVYGISLLELAIKRERKEVLALLIEEGADVNAITLWGNLTPLDIAEKEGMNEIAEILRKHGGKRSSELRDIE